MGTAGPAGRSRLGRPGVALLLLVPLLAVGAVSLPSSPVARRDAAAAAEAGRIVYAGTEHRSLGRVKAPRSSEPLFGPGPVHLDRQPSARGDMTVFTSLRDGTLPQVYLRQGNGAVRKLTTGRDAAHPRLAPDRTSVVFDSREAGGRRDLWIVGVDGTGARKLTDSAADETSPTFSPDGARIAYSSDVDTARGRQIYTRALAGGPQTRISHGPPGDATEPVWNPVADPAHRDLVAYTLDARGATGPQLRVTDGSGLDEPLLGGDAANWTARSADWLPEGNDVVFVSPDRTCDCTSLYDHVFQARNRAAEVPRLVLDEDRAVASPTWLGTQADGAVVVERTSAPATHTATLQDIRTDGADPRDLGLTVLKEDPAADTTTDPAADPLFNPRAGYDPWTERQNYTPDGRRIVVTRFEDSEAGRIQRIWLADADGTNAAPVPLAGRGLLDWDTDPTFSPDGKLLAFTRTSPGGTGGKGGPGRILIADATSGALVGRIDPPAGQPSGGDAQPAWSPDGTTIAFTRNHVIGGNGGNKHVWTAPVASPDRQRDLSAALCPGDCQVIDDSPAFSPDGRGIALNRKDGGGRINERNGILLASPTGEGCQVVLPADLRDNPAACRQELPETSSTGPFQPRDVAWTADGGTLVFSARRARAPNSPEGLKTLDLADGKLTHLTRGLPGRQKEPGVHQSVDLTLDAPSTAPPVKTGSATSVTVTVTNKGPAASPGTVFTAAPPPGVRLDRLSSTAGRCADGSPQCSLGVLRPGASVRVTAHLTGVTAGRQRLEWSVAGAVVDPRPDDNAARTGIEVQDEERPPTRPPTTAPPSPSAPPTSRPPTRPAPPPPPAHPAPPPPPPPVAGPGVTVTAQPDPGFVGGRVVVTYLVRNGDNALATGLRLRLGLPARIPAEPLPAGCAAGACALPDLAPGDTTVTRVVLKPDKALAARIVATLTTTGTDADPGDNVARVPLRILQPRIVAVPPLGKPGFVTLVRGRDFPPGAPVTLTWEPGITAAAAPSRPGADFRFTAQLLILAKDRTGPRTITARGPGFGPVTTPFLVVNGSVQPPYEVDRR